MAKKRLVVLCGPAAAGKRTLISALERACVSFTYVPPVRTPLASDTADDDGRWYQDTPSGQVRSLSPDWSIVDRCGERLVAFSFKDLADAFAATDAAISILPCAIVSQLPSHRWIQDARARGNFELRVVLVSPLSNDELAQYREVQPQVVEAVVLARQIWRRIREGGQITALDFLGMQRRAQTAFQEMGCFKYCTDVLVLKIGPGSPAWLANPPASEAGEALAKLIAIVKGG